MTFYCDHCEEMHDREDCIEEVETESSEYFGQVAQSSSTVLLCPTCGNELEERAACDCGKGPAGDVDLCEACEKKQAEDEITEAIALARKKLGDDLMDTIIDIASNPLNSHLLKATA